MENKGKLQSMTFEDTGEQLIFTIYLIDFFLQNNSLINQNTQNA